MDTQSASGSAPSSVVLSRGQWVRICALEDIIPDTGVCALVERKQVAIFRLSKNDAVYAVSNFDPCSDAFVLSRGIVGDKAGMPKVASPVYKNNFDLATGICLEDPAVVLPTYRVRVRDGEIELFVTGGLS